jgi:hypothetical protein
LRYNPESRLTPGMVLLYFGRHMEFFADWININCVPPS